MIFWYLVPHWDISEPIFIRIGMGLSRPRNLRHD